MKNFEYEYYSIDQVSSHDAVESFEDGHIDVLPDPGQEASAVSPKQDGPAAAALAHWRPAEALKKLQSQVNAAFPGRSKASDGMIGDINHCPGSSDHCPNIPDAGIGVVTAYDITHDPNGGCDMHDVANSIRSSRDPRIKYVIWNRQIFSSYNHSNGAAWTWRAYSGSNPHTKHAHFSVLSAKAQYDDTSDWTIGPGVGGAAKPTS